MAEPGLNEIINIARDPGAGAISTRPTFNFQQLAQAANNAAQSKAENDLKKYSMFMDNLKGVYKELGEIQGLDVAQADRPGLQKEAASIFEEIDKDPGGFFGGKMAKVEERLGKLRSQSTQSAQDHVFDQAHRAYLDRDPTLNTPENKSKMDAFFKQPLGQRQLYTLDVAALYNPQAIAEQINAVIPQKFSTTGLSPDGNFINTTTGIRYDEKQYKTLADQLFLTQDPKTGRVLADEVSKRFSQLPAPLQEAYKQKHPEDPVKGFYDDTVMPWRKPDQIEKTESKVDPFALEAYKSKDKLKQMAVKFGYDKVLEAMKIGGQKDIAKYREQLKSKSKKEQTGALNGIVDNKVNEAITDGQAPKDIPPGLLNDDIVYTMPISSATLRDFSRKKEIAGKSVDISPDQLLVSADGKRVYEVFRSNGGKFQSVQKFDIDEFKLRFGKDVLGVSATEKEINADDDGGETSSSSSTTISTESTAKKPKLY